MVSRRASSFPVCAHCPPTGYNADPAIRHENAHASRPVPSALRPDGSRDVGAKQCLSRAERGFTLAPPGSQTPSISRNLSLGHQWRPRSGYDLANTVCPSGSRYCRRRSWMSQIDPFPPVESFGAIDWSAIAHRSFAGVGWSRRRPARRPQSPEWPERRRIHCSADPSQSGLGRRSAVARRRTGFPACSRCRVCNRVGFPGEAATKTRLALMLPAADAPAAPAARAAIVYSGS